MDRAAPVFPGIQTAQISLSSTPANVGYDHVLRLVGQNVSVALVEKGAGGARLELPSGQMLTAQGDLPFPEQTQLQVKISFQNGAIRLQVLEAQPPSLASFLAPLVQGEAAGLFQQLQSQRPPEALAPLVKLFEALFSSNEMKIQQAIDSLPASSQQLLSQILGTKNASPAALSRAMLERFEPTASLLDKMDVFFGRQIIFGSSHVNNEDKSNSAPDASINDLRDLLLKFVESNLTKQSNAASADSINKTNQLLELLKPQLLPNLLPLPKETMQGPLKEASIADNLEKLMLALKLLPDDARSNLSSNIVGRANSDIETIAKTIIGKLEANIEKIMAGSEKSAHSEAGLKEALAKIIQALDKAPIPIRKEIGLAVVGSADAGPKTIAESLIQKIFGFSLDKIGFPKMDAAPPAIGQLLASVPEGARQVLAEVLADALGGAIDGALDDALDGAGAEAARRANASPKPGAQAPVQLQSQTSQSIEGAGAKPGAQALVQPQSRPPEGAAKPGMQSLVQPQSLPSQSIEGAGAKPAPQAPALVEGASLAGSGSKLDMQKLIQAVEDLPLSVRRAIASAVLNDAGAEPEAIAGFLAQKGLASNVRQGIASGLETAPPILRQIIALFSRLPLDAPPSQIAETLVNGDRAILDAAKALLSMDDDEPGPAPVSERQIASTSQNKENAASLSDIKNSPLVGPGKENALNDNVPSAQFASRLGYLLQLEALGAQNSFPAEAKNSLASWFNSIADILFRAKAPKPEAAEAGWTDTPHKSSAAPLGSAASQIPARSTSLGASPRAAGLLAEQAARPSEAPLEKPQTWQAWVKDSIQALINPRVSARESVFHALAAKEGVNYFELPMPWMPDRQMEIWVETDADGGEGLGGKEKESHRILLALNFTVLGETRVGIESAAKRLNIKIWAERPHFIENEAPKMQNELAALGFDIQVSIQPLASEHGGAAPSIKSLIVGSSLHAVG